MVWIVGSFPVPSVQVSAQTGSAEDESLCLRVLTSGMLVQAHYRDQGRREKAEGFCEGFMPLICVIGKQIDISYLPLSYLHIKY